MVYSGGLYKYTGYFSVVYKKSTMMKVIPHPLLEWLISYTRKVIHTTLYTPLGCIRCRIYTMLALGAVPFSEYIVHHHGNVIFVVGQGSSHFTRFHLQACYCKSHYLGWCDDFLSKSPQLGVCQLLFNYLFKKN